MIKRSSSQNGSAFAVIAIILVVAIVGALGFVYWQNLMAADDTQSKRENGAQSTEKLCSTSNDKVEMNGVFCSEDIGIEFKIPEPFVGKISMSDNYAIFEGPMDASVGNSTGKSLVFYKAIVTSGEESMTLSVAKEPLRSGYSSIGHSLQRTYFNADKSSLYLINGPTTEYDSATGISTTSGSWSAGEPVPSFDVAGTKVYHGRIGDAGVVEDGYLMIVNDDLIIVKIRYAANPMNESTIDYEKPFADLNSYMKQLKFLK